MNTYRILHGDAREQLKTLPDGCVQTCVTSPPYWGLRDYGHAGQIGLEPTPDAFVASMVAVFSDVRRVLADDGTVWLNLGDTYDESDALIGIPWRVAFALMADGWRVESEVVWAKPKGAPAGGVKKPLRCHEQILLLSKRGDYFYDADAVREPLSEATLERYRYSVKAVRSRTTGATSRKMLTPNPLGRYRRSVWLVAPTSTVDDGEHFAAYPEKLIEPCILAGSRIGDTVLDPFTGSGTTGAVAIRHQRNFIGCELNADYIALAEKRIGSVAPLFSELIA